MLGGVLIAVIVLFTSWGFADLWFDNYGGLRWFWTAKDAGALHMVSRLSFVLALLSALAMAVASSPTIPAIAGLGFLACHTTTMLIMSERWRG